MTSVFNGFNQAHEASNLFAPAAHGLERKPESLTDLDGADRTPGGSRGQVAHGRQAPKKRIPP